jgi:hypothetical protein
MRPGLGRSIRFFAVFAILCGYSGLRFLPGPLFIKEGPEFSYLSLVICHL